MNMRKLFDGGLIPKHPMILVIRPNISMREIRMIEQFVITNHQ